MRKRHQNACKLLRLVLKCWESLQGKWWKYINSCNHRHLKILRLRYLWL